MRRISCLRRLIPTLNPSIHFSESALSKDLLQQNCLTAFHKCFAAKAIEIDARCHFLSGVIFALPAEAVSTGREFCIDQRSYFLPDDIEYFQSNFRRIGKSENDGGFRIEGIGITLLQIEICRNVPGCNTNHARIIYQTAPYNSVFKNQP